MDIEEMGNTVIGAAIKVHRALGPGLLVNRHAIMTHLRP